MVAGTLDSNHGNIRPEQAWTNRLVTHALRADGFDASEDGTGRGIPLVANPLTARMHKGVNTTMDEGQTMIPVAFSCKDHGADAGELAPTLRSMNERDGNANAGGQVAIEIQERAVCENPDAGPDGVGVQEGLAYTLEARSVPQAVAFQSKASHHQSMNPSEISPSLDVGKSAGVAVAFAQNQREEVRELEVAGAIAGIRRGDAKNETLLAASAVRRLTPRECERLQGFPDDYTLIQVRSKLAADGPRYKALGNSMAVPVIRWIGKQIVVVDSIGGSGL